MLKNFSLMDSESHGKKNWKLIGPNGAPVAPFSAFADSMLRNVRFNTRRAYSRYVAEFLDYMFEAISVLSEKNDGLILTNRLIKEIIESFDEYLVLGGDSGNEISVLVNKTKPSPKNKPTSSAIKHSAIRNFLNMSETIRREMHELIREGLLDDKEYPFELFSNSDTRKEISSFHRRAITANSLIAAVVAGGPKFAKSAILPTVSSQIRYDEKRAFPLDSISGFIEHLPTYRDKALYSLEAASGCRGHEGLQLLFDDIDPQRFMVLLRDPFLRISHPSYRFLTSLERDKLAWKGRTTELTVLIEPFASMFFKNLELYIRYEYVPHGLHRFIFQHLDATNLGRPYFLSAPNTRLQIFKEAVIKAGVVPVITRPHSLRHSYGVYLLNYFPRINGDYGLPVPLVQQIMGHVDPISTLKYARHDADLMILELKHANEYIYQGNTRKSIIELKIESLNFQVEKFKDELARNKNI